MQKRPSTKEDKMVKMLTALEARELYETLELCYEAAQEVNDGPLLVKISESMDMLGHFKDVDIEDVLGES